MWKQVKYICPRPIKSHPEFSCVHSNGQSLRAPCAVGVHGSDKALGTVSMLLCCHWEEHGDIGQWEFWVTKPHLGLIVGSNLCLYFRFLAQHCSEQQLLSPETIEELTRHPRHDLIALFQLPGDRHPHMKWPDQLITSLFVSARQPRAELARNRNHR